MKQIHYSLNDSDVETILFTLSILPSLSLEDTDIQSQINMINCESAAKKLISSQPDFTPNELRVIAGSLLAAQLVNHGSYDVDDETRRECSRFFFSINKLVSVFNGFYS